MILVIAETLPKAHAYAQAARLEGGKDVRAMSTNQSGHAFAGLIVRADDEVRWIPGYENGRNARQVRDMIFRSRLKSGGHYQ